MEKTELLNSILAIADNKKSELASELDHAQKRIQELQTHVLNAETNIKVYKEGIVEIEIEVPKLTEALETYTVTPSVVRHTQKLLMHPLVHNLSVEDNTLVIDLQPLFTKVKLTEKGRKVARRFIGCFRVTIKQDRIYINSLSFPRAHRSHWSISSNLPCWGTWEQVQRELREKGYLDSFVTMIVQYLQSTLDTGAYTTAQSWIEDIRNRNLINASVPVPSQLCIVTQARRDYTDNEGISLLFLPALYISNNRLDSSLFYFKVPIEGHNDYGSDRNSWNIVEPITEPITEEELTALLAHTDKEKIREACKKLVEAKQPKVPKVPLPDVLDALTDEEAVAKYDQLINLTGQSIII